MDTYFNKRLQKKRKKKAANIASEFVVLVFFIFLNDEIRS